MTDQVVSTDPAALVRCEIVLRDTNGAAERATLLTEGVYDVIAFLTDAARRAPDGAAVVDVLVEASPDSAASTEAFIEAVRGLVQSFTLEKDATCPAINIVVSTAGQDAARLRTLEYLAGEDGRFSRGTTYDLRETAR